MLGFLWDLSQQSQIHQAQGEASAARQRASRAESAYNDIDRRLNALTLASMAMWSILSERIGVTEDELIARMEHIDLRDGVRDGKPSATPRQCSSCRRTANARRDTCIYCGANLIGGPDPFGRAM